MPTWPKRAPGRRRRMRCSPSTPRRFRAATSWRRGSPSSCGRARSARRCGAASGSSSSAAWPGPGARGAADRRGGPRAASGTERVLVNPMVLDPTGGTTLDAWQPDKEGRLLAYQLSSGGDKESCCGCSTWRPGRRWTGRSTGPATPRRLAARRRTRSTTYAGCPAGAVPAGRGAVPPPGLPAPGGHPATEDVMIFGAGQDKTSYYGVG